MWLAQDLHKIYSRLAQDLLKACTRLEQDLPRLLQDLHKTCIWALNTCNLRKNIFTYLYKDLYNCHLYRLFLLYSHYWNGTHFDSVLWTLDRVCKLVQRDSLYPSYIQLNKHHYWIQHCCLFHKIHPLSNGRHRNKFLCTLIWRIFHLKSYEKRFDWMIIVYILKIAIFWHLIHTKNFVKILFSKVWNEIHPNLSWVRCVLCNPSYIFRIARGSGVAQEIQSWGCRKSRI